MNNEENKTKDFNCMNIHRKRQKNHGFWVKMSIVMKKEGKRWGMNKLKILNYINILRKRQKNHWFWVN